MDTEESNSSDAEVIETGDIPDFYDVQKNVEVPMNDTEELKDLDTVTKNSVIEYELLLQNGRDYFQLYQDVIVESDEIKQQFYQFKCMIMNYLKTIRETSVCKELKMNQNVQQINKMLQEIHELKQQNIQKQSKLSQTQKENEILRNDRDKMQNKNMQQQKEIAVLKTELDEQKEIEFQLKQLKEENGLLKDEIAVLKMKNIDVTDYINWSVTDFLNWILSLENGRYKKYKKKLQESMMEEEITGECLADIEESNLKDWGLKSFKDRKSLLKHIKSLSDQSQNNVGKTMVSEGINQTLYH